MKKPEPRTRSAIASRRLGPLVLSDDAEVLIAGVGPASPSSAFYLTFPAKYRCRVLLLSQLRKQGELAWRRQRHAVFFWRRFGKGRIHLEGHAIARYGILSQGKEIFNFAC